MQDGRRLSIVVLALTLLLPLAACAPAAPPAASPPLAAGQPVAIGLVGPLSGGAAEAGRALRQAVALAVDDANRAGGIGGHPVRAVEADDRGDPKAAAAAAHALAADPAVLAVIGGSGSVAGLAVAPVYQQAGLVYLCPTCAHPDFTRDGDYIFSLANPPADEGRLSARFAVATLGARRVAVLWRKDDWGLAVRERFEQALPAVGGAVVLSVGLPDDARDFGPIVRRVAALDPDAVYLALYAADAAALLRQARQLGLTRPVIGSGTLARDDFLRLAGPAADGVYLPAAYTPDHLDPRRADVARRYQERYGQPLDAAAAHAHDAAALLLAALRQSDLTRPGVRDALGPASRGLAGLTGDLTLDAARRVHKDVTWLRVENGALRAISHRPSVGSGQWSVVRSYGLRITHYASGAAPAARPSRRRCRAASRGRRRR